jgi:hypothetical protein
MIIGDTPPEASSLGENSDPTLHPQGADSAGGEKSPAGCREPTMEAAPVGRAQEFAFVTVLAAQQAQLWQLVQTLPAGLQAMV